MRSFSFNKKTGIYTEEICKVYRHGLNGLYYESRGRVFNLPSGKYDIQGNFRIIKPVQFKKNKLPVPEHNSYNFRKPHTIIVEKNSHKAQIDIFRCIIYIDPSFFIPGSSLTAYILNHELGHHFFNTESYCDMFAENRLIDIGFNPSQILEPYYKFMSKEDRIISALKRQKKWEI